MEDVEGEESTSLEGNSCKESSYNIQDKVEGEVNAVQGPHVKEIMCSTVAMVKRKVHVVQELMLKGKLVQYRAHPLETLFKLHVDVYFQLSNN